MINSLLADKSVLFPELLEVACGLTLFVEESELGKMCQCQYGFRSVTLDNVCQQRFVYFFGYAFLNDRIKADWPKQFFQWYSKRNHIAEIFKNFLASLTHEASLHHRHLLIERNGFHFIDAACT